MPKTKPEQYHALHIASAYHDDRVSRLVEGSDVAFIDIGFSKELHSTVHAMAVYTSEDGPSQDYDLETYAGTEVRPVSRQELVHVLTLGVPLSVFLDGGKLAAQTVFKRRIRQEMIDEVLGL